MDLPRVIERLRPGANPLYTSSEADSLDDIVEWRDDQEREIPTQQEVDAEWVVIQAEQAEAEAIASVKTDALTAAANIPNWASWTEAQADSWVQTNLRDERAAILTGANGASTLAAMKPFIIRMIELMGVMITVMWALARMVIALRNERWPHLQS